MQIGVGPEDLIEDRVHTSEGATETDVDACARSRTPGGAIRAPDAHEGVTVA